MKFFNKETKFWVLFFTLNMLLFLPKFCLNLESSTFFPEIGISVDFGQWIKLAFRRENNDIFRLSFDFLILTWGLFLFSKFTKIPRWFFISVTSLYILFFYYQVYQGTIYSLYQQIPLFYSDVILIKEAVSILYSTSIMWLSVVILTFVSVAYLLYLLVAQYIRTIEDIQLSFNSKVAFSCLSVICLVAFGDYITRLGDQRLAVPLKAFWIFDNIDRSIKVKNSLLEFQPKVLSESYNYEHVTVGKMPNIYLLFIESYGKVLYDNNNFGEEHLSNLMKNQRSLEENNWHSVSTFSESPVKGGRSWLSYTSFVMGSRIDNHATYDYIVNRAKFEVPTLFKSLKTFGYQNYWVSAIHDKRSDIPSNRYDEFYGIDDRIDNVDMDFKGQLYGGAYPAPADQFSLNFANEYISHDTDKPFVLFFITLNSHHPFDAPKNPVKDWKLLANTGGISAPVKQASNYKLETNYLAAINYEIDHLTDFIIDKGTEDDVFILIGDHQPPLIANKSQSFETPVHIISKNDQFIKGLNKYNFKDGLIIEDVNKPLRHEAFHSLLMNEILINYGKAKGKIPEVFLQGVPLNGIFKNNK